MGNRLASEKSPYLLQHSENPVDWYPWGEEAFAKAKAEDKPIFLSIGYATCHWCHVMEKESFENGEIAQMMNDTFVNIKVDREEHPEVDSIYMEFAQALMSSAGGWPLNVVLTPDLKPFFAVTYLPTKAGKGLIGMDQFVTQIQMLWNSEERAMLIQQADKIVELFESSSKTSGPDMPSNDDLQRAVEMLFDIADPVYGGIKGEPKFPLGYQADFLLQFSKANKDSRSLFYIELTLQMMARGGIFDHLGGGFSRYCVDERWHVPHFEKMLYDNAILAKTYLEVYKYTKKPFFGQISRQTLDYALRELKGEGFYSAEDADTEGQEGKYYVWTQQEILDALGPGDGEVFCRYYGVSEEGNFEGKNVLHVPMDPKEFAPIVGLEEDKLHSTLHTLKTKLHEKRGERKKPFKDDKIITSWNGLMIDVLARAGFCFQEGPYLEAATSTANWIKQNLWREGQLLRRYRDGEARFSAGLDDHAFLIRALLTLFEVGAGTSYLHWAMELTDILERDFKTENGAFFQTKEDEFLLIRKCEFYDGAEPSGNAVHCENLLRLYQLTQEQKYLTQAEDILKAAKTFIEAFPPGACYHLIALQRYYDKEAPLIVIALDENHTFEPELKKALGGLFCPHGFIVWKYPGDQGLNLPALSEQNCIEGKTTVHICRGDRCQPPMTDMDQILSTLDDL
ncbi:MAG: thioredoxin domain-containing protein [Simkaniaceae bacterium]|nr:thioredoxin domain-containing protein [Candidatus Sacchlamyda saccharinae]